MRILMVIERYIPIWGGAENQLRQLIPHLLAKDCEVEVVTRRWEASLATLETVDSVTVHRLGIPGTGVIPTLFFVIALCFFLLTKGRSFSVFHSHGVVNMGVLCRLACFFTGKVNVAKIATAGKILPLRATVSGKVLLWIFKKSDAIAAISTEIRNELRNIATEPHRIFSTTNGVDCGRFHPASKEQKATLRSEAGFKADDCIVLFSGRLVQRKGLDILIRAWSEVVHSAPNTHLLIMGSGRNQPDSIEREMVARVRELEIPNIHFRGETDQPEKYLSMADIFAFPSRLEGFPNALMEAMACGLPTVSTMIGGVTDLITDQKTGLLIPSEDHLLLARQILFLHDNPEKASLLGENARRLMLEKYSFESICSDYFSLYENLIN